MEAGLSELKKKLNAEDKAITYTKEYAALKTDEERFAYTIRLTEEYDIKPKLRLEEKNAFDSERFRTSGNDLFLSKQSRKSMDKILEYYTKSIAYAEPGSRAISQAYGNRSALLYRARLYDHCILDIDRALRFDCTGSLRIKLTTRRLGCSIASGKSSAHEINETFDAIQRAIDELGSDNPHKIKHENDLKDLKKPGKLPPQRELFDEEKYKPATPDDNPEIPGASSALEISYDDQFGRHIRAKRKILPGQVLSVQKGYATILAPEHFYTHCSNCLRQTWSAVPCDRCVHVVYCDEKCRDEAWRDHHDVECRVIGAMLDLGCNLLSLMSLRLAIRAVKEAGGFEGLEKKLSAMSWPDPRLKGFTGVPLRLNEKDYASVYTLATNTEKRPSSDLIGRSFNAAFILYCVATITDFLGEKLPPDWEAIRKNPWSILVGGLITKHQQIIPSNVHTVSEMIGIEDRERGASLIPFLSLFNHSCECMVTRVNYGDYIVLYAVQTIEAGEQIFDNYGQHYALNRRDSRKSKLRSQFYFECDCVPCAENWPLFHDIDSWTMQGLDRTSVKKLRKVLMNFERYVDIATVGNIEDKLYIIKDLAKMLETLSDCVHLPCLEINQVVETLKRAYVLLSSRYQSLSSD